MALLFGKFIKKVLFCKILCGLLDESDSGIKSGSYGDVSWPFSLSSSGSKKYWPGGIATSKSPSCSAGHVADMIFR